jgi:hypothetical protein
MHRTSSLPFSTLAWFGLLTDKSVCCGYARQYDKALFKLCSGQWFGDSRHFSSTTFRSIAMALRTVLLKKPDVDGRPETVQGQKSPYLVENTGFFELLGTSKWWRRRLLNTAF